MELAEVLVGFEDNIILNLPTDHIFQSAMSVLIVDVYLQSVSGVLVPLHSCWVNPTHLYNIQHSLNCICICVLTYFTFLTCIFILTQKRIIRATTTAVAVLLTFIKFTMTYKTQRVSRDGMRGHISYMKASTRLLYVFYRDGILLFIP